MENREPYNPAYLNTTEHQNMYPRTNYEMSKSDFQRILNASKPTPAIMLHIGGGSRGPQENANSAWSDLGRRMGFDYMSVRPITGKGARFFTAIPSENEQQGDERLKREADEKRALEITALENEITAKQQRLDSLKGETVSSGNGVR